MSGLRLGFSPINAMMLDLGEAFRLAVELDLQFIELTHDLQEIEPRSQHPQLVHELMRATGLGVTVHLSYIDLNLASLMPGVRENSVARTNRGLEYAATLGAHCGVLHSGLIPLRHPLLFERASQALAQSLSEVKPLVPVVIENLALDAYDLLRGPSELEDVSKRAGFGNCIDVGHALVEGCSTDLEEAVSPGGLLAGRAKLESYKTGLSKIMHLHLQDNDGSADQHRALGSLGANGIDWAAQRDWLRNFSGTVDLEINGGPDEVRSSVRFLRQLLGD